MFLVKLACQLEFHKSFVLSTTTCKSFRLTNQTYFHSRTEKGINISPYLKSILFLSKIAMFKNSFSNFKIFSFFSFSVFTDAVNLWYSRSKGGLIFIPLYH